VVHPVFLAGKGLVANVALHSRPVLMNNFDVIVQAVVVAEPEAADLTLIIPPVIPVS
jgi:hypothetical protein